MKPKISLNNRYSLKPWTYVLNVVLLYYLLLYSVACFSLFSFWRPKVAKSQSGQINQYNNKFNGNYNRNIKRVSHLSGSKSNDNVNSRDKGGQNHGKAANQVSFIDWFVSNEVDSLMHNSNTAKTVAQSSGTTYDIEICSIDRRLKKNDIYEKLDKLVNKFEDVALRDNDKVAENLRNGLAEAIKLDEIAEEQHKYSNSINLNNYVRINESINRNNSSMNSYKKKISPSKGLPDLLDEIDPNIVHRKILSNKAIKKLIAFAMNQPKYSDKLILSKMFAHVLENTLERDKQQQQQGQQQVEKPYNGNLSDDSDSNPEVTKSTAASTNSKFRNSHTRVKKVGKAVTTAVTIALFVFEELYLSPSFLEHLPVIGAGIRKLKKFGQSPYDIIQAVRSVHEFLIHYNEAPGDDPILKISHIMNRGSPLMFSQKGLDSLSRIATKLVEANKKGQALTDEDRKEIAGRSAFYFFINLAKSLGGCKLSNRAHNVN